MKKQCEKKLKLNKKNINKEYKLKSLKNKNLEEEKKN